MRLRLQRLSQPGGEVLPARLGDGIAAPLRTFLLLDRRHLDATASLEPLQRRVHLAERQRVLRSKRSVVAVLQLVTMQWFALEQAEERVGNRHRPTTIHTVNSLRPRGARAGRL